MSVKPCINGRFLHQPVAGVQRYGREILSGFDRAGYPYEILEPSPSLSSNKLTGHFWEQMVLPRRAKEAGALWSPANSGPIYSKNHIITFHDIGIFPHPEWFSTSYRRWKRFLVPRIAKHARKIITVSEFSKQIICSYLNINPEKVLVVYNGVDRRRFKPAGSARVQQVLEKYSLSRPYFFALGSMDPRKNFSRLVDAWNRCVEQESVTGYELVIAGGSNANFRDFDLGTSSTLKFLGYVDDDDLAPLYSGSTGFLFPSLFEGFGLPVIEAMACGSPVLTSNSTALGEIAGNAALTISPGSVNAIKEGIMHLLESSSLRNRLVERGYERAKQFDWDEAACRIYKHLTN